MGPYINIEIHVNNDTTPEQLHHLTKFIQEITMATLDDKVEAIGTKVDALTTAVTTLAASGVKVDLSSVLSSIAGVQTTANAILAQDLPTPPTAPVLSALSPASGSIAGGETVTATGTGFEGVTGVMVGTVAATKVTVVSDTSLTYVSPAQGAGPEDVTIVGPGGTSAVVPAGVFTYS